MVEVAQMRTIPVSKAAKNVAEFTFSELCEEARGSPDYSAIARQFNSIILRGVPQLTMTRRDLMRRFILLIDALYYQHRNVIIESAVSLDELFDVPADAK
jgi:predicted ATPase